jgi:hypothetical protein
VDFDRAAEIIGNRAPLEELWRLSVAVYELGAAHARERGIILADTKFEFGRRADGTIVLLLVLCARLPRRAGDAGVQAKALARRRGTRTATGVSSRMESGYPDRPALTCGARAVRFDSAAGPHRWLERIRTDSSTTGSFVAAVRKALVVAAALAAGFVVALLAGDAVAGGSGSARAAG